MTSRLALAALLGLASIDAARADAPFYVQLDGHWYTVADGPRMFWNDGYGFYMPTTTASGCRRADGQSQTFGGTGLYVGMFFFPVYRITSFKYRTIPQLPGKFVMKYVSEPGNIICDNEIPSPIPDQIFRNGFERPVPADAIFIDSFDGAPVSVAMGRNAKEVPGAGS
jgi:hypothetical protein